MPNNNLPDIQDTLNHPTAIKGIDIDKIVEHRAKGLTYEEIGTLLGCNKSNIAYHLEKLGLNGELEDLEAWKKHKADILALKQREILKTLNLTELKKIPPGSRVVSFGILYDKERLERGQSTENLAVDTLLRDLDD
uniref:Putative DNA binding, helix-turn-helix domain containing protein n=1 Tax=viral metagenome TaxID=1070528 RepID=A0A6M3J291_9ZZZZ